MNAIRAQCVVLLLLHVLPFVGRPAPIGTAFGGLA